MTNRDDSMESSEASEPTTTTTSGPVALTGYIYQRDVSLWLALHLIIEKGRCDALTVEPVDEEDAIASVEASSTMEKPLTLEEARNGHAETTLRDLTLSVQVKMRNTDPWNIDAINKVLTHGTRRVPALDALDADPHRHFLFVTNAAVQGVAKNLRARSPLSFSRRIPYSTAKLRTKFGTQVDLDARIGVLPDLDTEKLDGRIDRILSTYLKVPTHRLADCRKALAECVFVQMTKGGGSLTRSTIERIVTTHGGYLGPFGKDGLFVPPKNYAKIQSVFTQGHAVFIRGPSGTGKTTVAWRLIGTLMNADTRGREIIEAKHPDDVPESNPNRPVLVYIEDPFGHYSLSPNARLWVKALPALLREADPDRIIVVTSRSDLFAAAGAKNIGHSLVKLHPEEYDAPRRARLFNAHLNALPANRQDPVYRERRYILQELETPLEFDKFFSRISAHRDEDGPVQGHIRIILASAKNTAIEDRLILALQDRNLETPAALAWGLLTAFPKLDGPTLDRVLSQLELDDLEGLRTVPDETLDAVESLFTDLVDKHSLRRRDDRYVYRHNRDEKGLRLTFQKQRREASRHLSRLVGSLLDEETEEAEDAAIALAVRIENDGDWLARETLPTTPKNPFKAMEDAEQRKRNYAAASARRLKLTLPRPFRARMDEALVARALRADGTSVRSAFEHLALVGSEFCPEARLARWLLARSGKDSDDFADFMMASWIDIQEDDAFYEEMKDHPSTRPLLRSYVTHGAPGERHHRLGALIAPLYRLDPEIGPTFQQALIDNVDRLGGINASFLAEGAFRDIDQADSVVEVVCDALQRLEDAEPWPESDDWESINDIMSDEEAQWHGEHLGMESQDTANVLETYVDRVREAGQWEKLKTTLNTPESLLVWLRATQGQDVQRQYEEMAYLREALKAHGREVAFWSRASRAGDGPVEFAWEALASETASVSEAASSYLVQSGAELGAERITNLRALRGSQGVIEAVYHWETEVRQWQDAREDQTNDALTALASVRRRLPTVHPIDPMAVSLMDVEQSVLGALGILQMTPQQADATVEQLEGIRNPASREFDLAVLKAQAARGKDVRPELEDRLQARSTPTVWDRNYLEMVTQTLCDLGFADAALSYVNHPHCTVARTAAAHCLATADAFPEALEALLKSKSRSVMEVLWSYLGDKPADAVQPQLEALLENEAHDLERTDIERVFYPYAERAAERLLDLRVDDLAMEMDSLRQRAWTTQSDDLAWDLVQLIVRHSPAATLGDLLQAALNGDEPATMRQALLAAFIAEASPVDLSTIDHAILFSQFRRTVASHRISMALVIGLHANDEQLEALVDRFGAMEIDQLMTIPLAAGFANRSEKLDTSPADQEILESRKRAKLKSVLRHIDPRLAELISCALTEGELIDPAKLGTLGHVGLRKPLVHRLSGTVFAEPKKAKIEPLGGARQEY